MTGGAGYIGSVVTEELLRGGDEVVVYDSLYKGHREAVVEGATFVKGDLLDTTFLRETLTKHKVEAVVHMAADSLVGESVKVPEKYYRNNVLGGLSLLDAMREAGAKYLVFSSTAAVYGEPAKQPIEESDPTQPTNPYGETKLAFERALRWYDSAHGLKYVSLRYFNAAGADLDGEIGESHEPESHLIPLAAKAALGKGPGLTVFGNDYDTHDGTPIRDYIHVVDLAAAHVEGLRRLIEGGENLILNVGTGAGHTVLEVIQAAERVAGMPVPHTIGPRRAGDPPSLVADSTELQRRFAWEPRHSDLETILRTAWRWQTERTY